MVDAQVVTVIVAHQRRWFEAERLAIYTRGKFFMDNGFLGEWKNTRRALAWGRSQGATHVVVLQDDAVPIPEFLTQVREAIKRRPDDVIGLYVGTGRPYAEEVLRAVQAARRSLASWLVSDGLIWGVGAVWPVPLIDHFLSWTDLWRHRLPYDQRALAWSQATGHRCYHTWPSLVNHADLPSVIKGRDHKLELVRVAHEVGVPDWNDVEVEMLNLAGLTP
jgi:hypothetical protein